MLARRPVAEPRGRSVELSRRDVAGDLGELLLVAGRRTPDPPHVVVEVEIGILDPHRMVEPEWDRGKAPAERRHQVQAALDHVADPLERVAIRDRGRVEHAHGEDVHVHVPGLEVQERCVESAQTFHG